MRQIAVLKETAGKGAFCSLVMAVVVVKDILVFCCFAVNLELSTVVRACRLPRPNVPCSVAAGQHGSGPSVAQQEPSPGKVGT